MIAADGVAPLHVADPAGRSEEPIQRFLIDFVAQAARNLCTSGKCCDSFYSNRMS